MARMIEKALLAGTIGLVGLTGCAAEGAGATPAQRTRTPQVLSQDATGMITIQPNVRADTRGIGVVCAGHEVSVFDAAGDSMTMDVMDTHGNILPNGAAVVIFPQGEQFTIGSGDNKPIYCETMADHPHAQNDVEQKFPKGTPFNIFTLGPQSSQPK